MHKTGPARSWPGSQTTWALPAIAPDAARTVRAAEVAQLDDTIAEFPGGYETMFGERGINLSGGQRQLAALARALARHPDIVLLDDALSAVDTYTEAEILQSLRTALAGRTTVIASHRISAIRDTSRTIVLDGGRIVEQGKHQDRLAPRGRYWRVLRRQQLEQSIEQGGRYWSLLRGQQREQSIEQDGQVLAAAAPSGTIAP